MSISATDCVRWLLRLAISPEWPQLFTAPEDVARPPQLRRVMELEANRELALTAEVRSPSASMQRLWQLDRERLEQGRPLER